MPKASLAKSESLYGVHPSVTIVQKWLAELKEESGRSMEEWLALVKREGPKEEKSRSATSRQRSTESGIAPLALVSANNARSVRPRVRETLDLRRRTRSLVRFPRRAFR